MLRWLWLDCFLCFRDCVTREKAKMTINLCVRLIDFLLFPSLSKMMQQPVHCCIEATMNAGSYDMHFVIQNHATSPHNCLQPGKKPK